MKIERYNTYNVYLHEVQTGSHRRLTSGCLARGECMLFVSVCVWTHAQEVLKAGNAESPEIDSRVTAHSECMMFVCACVHTHTDTNNIHLPRAKHPEVDLWWLPVSCKWTLYELYLSIFIVFSPITYCFLLIIKTVLHIYLKCTRWNKKLGLFY